MTTKQTHAAIKMDASVDRVCWDWHYSWLPWQARIATSNAPRSECWKCINFTSPFSNDEMTCKKKQTQPNSSARVWWKCGQCWNWSGLKNHFDASFGSGFDSGEFKSESASLEDKGKETQLQMRNDHGDVVLAANGCYPSFAGIAIRELGHNSGAYKHGYMTALDRTNGVASNGTLTEPGSLGAMELRTLIGTPACHAGSTAAGCTTFEPKVDNSAASSKVRTLTSDRLQQLQQLKFICLTDCTQKFTIQHEDMNTIHLFDPPFVIFVPFMEKSALFTARVETLFKEHPCTHKVQWLIPRPPVCGNCKTLLPSSWFCAGNHTRVRCLYSTDVFPDLDFCSFQGCSNYSGSEVRAISPKSSDDSLGVLMRVIYSHEARLFDDQKVPSCVDICRIQNAAVWCRLLGNISSDNGNVSIVELQRP